MKWVSVEDKLPETGQKVLTCDSSKRVFYCVKMENNFKVHYTVWDHSGVTHWMPLPEPPEDV
jgi:hypothetical protein